ncbi:MAG: lipopolysaccharide kinase InaA family protein [Planctomycetota bacterium]
MKSPLRMLNAWIDHRRLDQRSTEVEWRLRVRLGKVVTLSPMHSGGGADRIFLGRTNAGLPQNVCCVRMVCPWRRVRSSERGLPRLSLPSVQRLLREEFAYQRLHPIGLSPQIIAGDSFFLATHYVPWPRLSDVLRDRPERLWLVLPVLLSAISEMHAAGISHMDLNCGNVLVSPELNQVMFIDFEYGPRADFLFFDQQRFDFLRMVHSLLKRRRGLDAIADDPDRFAELFAAHAPESGPDIPSELDPRWFHRVIEFPAINAILQTAFGY